MPRLETQIDQIYLIHPETKKVSLILYEEPLNNFHHLFMLAELKDLQKKTGTVIRRAARSNDLGEAKDLKKISEIILGSFRSNKKLSAEILFETALAQINQNLADLAHEGHKGWVGKFSCLIALKSADNIFLANNGQTAAWLKRKSEILEILPAEQRGKHPLKTFQNFTQGKIANQDGLILTTTNIFNYVSIELLSKLSAIEISKILQDAHTTDQAFCSFFLEFTKNSVVAQVEPPLDSPVYAPTPEESNFSLRPRLEFLSRLRSWRMPKLKIKWQFFNQLSRAGKFFFVSFAIFIILFITNISAYGFKLRGQKLNEKINQQAQLVARDLQNLQSALIYKDKKGAFELLLLTQTDFNSLKKLDPTRIAEFSLKLEQLSNQVNRISIAADPKIYAEFKHHPSFLAKSPSGFLLSSQDSNSISLYNGTTNKDYFLLNSLKTNIVGISYWQPVGAAVASANEIYYIDQNLKQFETIVPFPEGTIMRLKTYNNILYALDNKAGRLNRITSSRGKYSTQVAASGDYSAVKDFAIDKDVYFLSADSIMKDTQVFPWPAMSEPITNATRIFGAGNLYVLEPSKKRVVIITKAGALVNQIYFPTSTTPLDLYVDEAQRNLYLLDDNKLLRITF